MFNVLLTTTPFFALVLLGYLAARIRLLPVSAIAGLNAFVLFFALPCMLFRFGANTPIVQMLDWDVFVVYTPVALVVIFFTVSLTLGTAVRWNDAAHGALVAVFPNTGFMGVPLLGSIFGQAAVAPVIITIVIDLVITSSLCVVLSRLDGAGAGVWRALRQVLRGLFANPLPWAIVLGGVFSWQHYELFGPLEKTVQLLGNAASPVALFSIGAVLARSAIEGGHTADASRSGATPLGPSYSTLAALVNSDLSTSQMAHHSAAHHSAQATQPNAFVHTAPLSSDALASARDTLVVALIKLLLHPVLTLLAGVVARIHGLGISNLELTILVLVACLPSASSVVLLAERYGADAGRIARIVVISTTLAFFTFSAAVLLLTG